MSKSSDSEFTFGLSGEQIGRLLSFGYNNDPENVGPHPYSSDSEHRSTQGPVDETETAPRIDGYEVIEKIAEAGQGQVWRALQQSTSRHVAIKIPRLGTVISERARIRFEREIELVARLKHPNIARIYDSGMNHGQYYYIMDFVEGLNLQEYVQQNDLPHRQILELMRTICQAVQYAHQNGIIHRDLKPANIIVTDDGCPLIVDFGLAKDLLEDNRGLSISMDGETVGTPAYMSPEQAAGHVDKVDTRTDIYSLGITLYTLLTGSNPHDLSGSRLEVMRRKTEEEVIQPRKLNPKIDKDIEALLLKALEKDLDRRYSTAKGLADDIDNYLRGEPLIARSPNNVYRLKKFVRRNAILSVAVLAVVVTLVLGLVGITVMYFRAEDALTKAKLARSETSTVSNLWTKRFLEADNFSDGSELNLEMALDGQIEWIEQTDSPVVKASLLHMVGVAYQRIGKLDLATQYLERAYQIRVEQLGPRSGDTGNTAHTLCWTYCMQGQLDKAYKLWNEQIDYIQKVSGVGNGRDLLYMFNIGYVYKTMGQATEAEDQFKKVMKLCERSKSEYRHYAMRFSGFHLGRMYLAQSRHEEAEDIFSKVLPVFQEIGGGLEGKGTLQCILALSRAYEAQGKREEAQQLCKTTIDTMHESLGDQHRILLPDKSSLGGILTQVGLFERAEQLLTQTLDVQRQQRGDADYATQESVKNLIELYEAWNKPEKANEWRAKLPQAEAARE